MTSPPGAAAEFVATPQDDGERIDRVVVDHLGGSRGQAQRLLDAGAVTVDGTPVGKSHKLTSGARVVVGRLPAPPPTAPPPEVPVRYEDADLLVVAKPAGLVVHAGAGTTGPTLVDALRAMGVPLAPGGDPDRPGIVHRLDRGTSGLLAVAKTTAARVGLTALLRRHDVERGYWALVDGVPDPSRATVDAPIARDPARRTRFRADPDGRRAVTHYDVAEVFGRAARLSVRLETGRTHQVRVHLSAVGHPVCGDVLYGADRTHTTDLGLTRPALHAIRLAFDHPVTGHRVACDEPPPADLAAALAALRAG